MKRYSTWHCESLDGKLVDYNEKIELIMDELESAKSKYPHFPKDLIHQVSIMNEESGEAIRAALNHYYHNEPISELWGELIQTAAMCIRVLENIEGRYNEEKSGQLEIFS